MKNNAKVFMLFLAFSVIPVFSGCSRASHSFIRTDVNVTGRIAVIIGDPKYLEEGLIFATDIEQNLTQTTKFTVIPQKTIHQIINDYPQKIKGPYTSASMQISENYSRTDIESINAIAEKIKADYVYIIWAPSAYTIDKTITIMPVISQLFEFPSKKEIAHAKYEIQWVEEGASVIGTNYTMKEISEKVSQDAVADIGKNLKALK